MKKIISIISVLALSFGLVACGGGNDAKTISIGVTPVPHEEIVRDVVAPILEEQGWSEEYELIFSQHRTSDIVFFLYVLGGEHTYGNQE